MARSLLLLLPLLIQLALLTPPSVRAYECCSDDMCAPLAERQAPPRYLEGPVQQPDTASGCLCKERRDHYVRCFGLFECVRVPLHINLTVPHLKLVGTAIRAVHVEDLAGYASLRQLDLENNNRLELIEERSFSRLTHLVNMSISYNHQLTRLLPDTFAGLTNLRELYLVSNGFSNVPDIAQALAPARLPALRDLILKENTFKAIREADFAPLENCTVRKLSIAHATIETIDPRSLNHFRHLEVLQIGVNFIEVQAMTDLIASMAEADVPLKSLNLYKMGLRKEPPMELLDAVANSSVECLSLAGNQFEIIINETFPWMENVKLLDLRDVSAFDICGNAFGNLPNLRTLLLSNNKLSEVPRGARIARLTYLDLTRNTEKFHLESYFIVDNYTMSNMTNLTVLNLSYNRMSNVYESTFAGLVNLKYLSMKKCELFKIGTKAFRVLTELIFLDLEENHFAVAKPNPLEADLFDGLINLKVLLLGRNNITYLTEKTFSGLTSLTHLSLNDNALTKLQSDVLRPLVNLQTLDLQRNELQPWHDRLFVHQDNLTTLLLSGNKFSSLTRSMLDDVTNLTIVDLKNNSFICDCAMYVTFGEWADGGGSSRVGSVATSGAACYPDQRPVTAHLTNAVNSKKCFRSYAPFLASGAVVLCLALVVAGLVYAYRWHLRYYLFLTRLQLIRKGRAKVAGGVKGQPPRANYEYDAFVSYSNEDGGFVARLVAMLENHEPFLRLCVYERDFTAGSVISESVMDGVRRSRRVLLVISDSYVRSHWCQWETHIAQHCRLFCGQEGGEGVGADAPDDSLVLVRLGPFDRKQLTPTLRYLLKTRVYLQWDEDEGKQSDFWGKLRRNLVRGRGELYTRL